MEGQASVPPRYIFLFFKKGNVCANPPPLLAAIALTIDVYRRSFLSPDDRAGEKVGESFGNAIPYS